MHSNFRTLLPMQRSVLATQQPRANTFDHYPVHRGALVCWQTVVIRSVRRESSSSCSYHRYSPRSTLSLNRALLWFVWLPSSCPSRQTFLPRLCMSFAARIEIERDGSASLSVLTGKYLSRHTPPPSTTSAVAAAATAVFVSSTRPSRSPTPFRSSRHESRFRATYLRTLCSERRAENFSVMQWWRSASRILRLQPSYSQVTCISGLAYLVYFEIWKRRAKMNFLLKTLIIIKMLSCAIWFLISLENETFIIHMEYS